MLSQLNLEQRAAVEQMQAFLSKCSQEQFFLLEGGAGRGKTYCVQALIRQLQKNNNRLFIAAVAPTHKAVRVMENMAASWDVHNVDFATIYQLLGMKMDINTVGERVLKEGRDSKLKNYELVLLDEASMVSSKLWKLLQEVAQRRRVKFILLGDRAQLPPVGEYQSPVFSEIALRAELHQIMRQSDDNPIGELIEAARSRVFEAMNEQQVAGLTINTQFNADKSKGVWFQDKERWLQNLIAAFKSPKYQDNPNFVRAIAWRNAVVDRINTQVRAALYDEAKQPYVIGERLIAKDAIFDTAGEEIVLANSSECQVTKVYPGTDDGYGVWKLTVMDSEGNEHRVNVLSEAFVKKHSLDCKALAAEARGYNDAGEDNLAIKAWKKYWELRQKYAQFRYSYAITSHCSQGDSIDNVFVARNDILSNPNPVEKWQSLYVSVSRAKERLVLS